MTKKSETQPKRPTSRQGVFTAEMLHNLIEAGHITQHLNQIDTTMFTIQPSSIDLTLGQNAYRIRASFLPGADRDVISCLHEDLVMHKLDITKGAVLERGCVYLVELSQMLHLPPDIDGFANPKSSTGRIDVFVRLITDKGEAFETVPPGYSGPLYAEICPRTFSIYVRTGSSLNQLRLRRGNARLTDQELADCHRSAPLVEGAASIKNGLGLSIRLEGVQGEVIGYRARRHAGLIDIDKVNVLPIHDYWEPIYASPSKNIILDPDEFYILASKEAIRIPANLAAEMNPIDPLLGEFRVHYAGFFDPGFGDLRGVVNGARAVLEVRGHDAPFILEDGQLVARLVYERLAARPQALYGADGASHYQGQGLKLSKHFKMDIS